jgi:hypothetical protein
MYYKDSSKIIKLEKNQESQKKQEDREIQEKSSQGLQGSGDPIQANLIYNMQYPFPPCFGNIADQLLQPLSKAGF